MKYLPKLLVDLSCMKFKRRLNVLKKQKSRPKENKIGAQPVLHYFSASIKYKMFCYGFIKTHYTFGSDLQNSFKEKEMRYCNAKLNVVSDVVCDAGCGLSKTITNCL